MIDYSFHRRLPLRFPAAAIPRVARDCSLIKKKYQTKTYQIGVTFVSEKEIQRLNHAYRGKASATDVLSFSVDEGQRILVPHSTKDPLELGDIVICVSYAVREAKKRKVEIGEELVRLLTHGTLHLMGYDHATLAEEQKMFAIQERIVASACARV